MTSDSEISSVSNPLSLRLPKQIASSTDVDSNVVLDDATGDNKTQEGDDSETESMWGYVAAQADEWLFQQTTDSVKQLPYPTRYILVLAVLAFAAAMFISSTYRGNEIIAA
jgi:hypothetical protein